MAWYALVDVNGNALSFGTEVPDPLPEGISSVLIDHPPGEFEAWDPITQEVIVVTPVIEYTDANYPKQIISVSGVNGNANASIVKFNNGYSLRIPIAPESLVLQDVLNALPAPTPSHALVGALISTPVPMITGAAVYLKDNLGATLREYDLAKIIAQMGDVPEGVVETQITVGTTVNGILTNVSLRLFDTGVAIGGAERDAETPVSQEFFAAVVIP
jgi:hypothetical protein